MRSYFCKYGLNVHPRGRQKINNYLQGNGTVCEENFETRPLLFDRAPQKMAKSKISAAMVRPYRRYDRLKTLVDTEFCTRILTIGKENSGNFKKLCYFRIFKIPPKNRFFLLSKINDFFKNMVRLSRNKIYIILCK
jgi:hypothetical protein